MSDLTSPGLIVAKGLLFLVTGLLAATILILQSPTWPTAVLLTVSIWCFCRFYYFAFYVLQHYVDPHFRYRGLIHAARYLRKGSATRAAPSDRSRQS